MPNVRALKAVISGALWCYAEGFPVHFGGRVRGHTSGRSPADVPHRQLRFWRILALAAMPARCSARTGAVPTALEP